MIVVLPQPFAPQITVSGFSNLISCISSGEKARMPETPKALMDDIFQDQNEACTLAGNDNFLAEVVNLTLSAHITVQAAQTSELMCISKELVNAP